MPAPLHPPPGEGGSGTATAGFEPCRQRRGYRRPDLRSALLWVFICWACSLASEEVSLALLVRPHALRFPCLHQHRRDWEESGVFPSSRTQKTTGVCRKPRRARPPTHAEGEPHILSPLPPAASSVAATSLVPRDPVRRCSGISAWDGREDAASRERRKGQEVL